MHANTPRPEYPRPQLQRKQHWLNLNGTWEFEIDHGNSGVARGLPSAPGLSGSIVVPFCPESALSGVGYKDFMASVWYRRDLQIPDSWPGDGRVLLHVGACDYRSTVYLDGREVGSHQGGFTPFTIDLTGALGGRRRGSLCIHAEDEVRSGAQAKGKQSHVFHSTGWDYTRTTGIWQTVWIEHVPHAYVASVRLTPQLKASSLQAEVRCGGAALPRGTRLLAEARDGERLVSWSEVECGAAGATATLLLNEVRPWSPEDPHLYDLTLRLIDVFGQEIDRVESYFGMRSIEINGYAIELNGRPYFQRLVLDQGFYPDGIYTAPDEEALRRDITLAKEMGFNGARLHQKVFEPRFLYLCDLLGYMAWGETPDWGLDVIRADGLSAMMTNWVEQIERDYSHPCIVGWMPFNEHDTRGIPEAFRAFYRMTRALDPTRPCIDSSGWMHVETCIYDVHDYTQDPAALEARYRGMLHGEEVYRCLDLREVHHNGPYRPGQPYFLSEMGGIWWNPGQKPGDPSWGYGNSPGSEQEFRDRFDGLIGVLQAHPMMCGLCYTQLTDVEQEVNGLLTYDRQPKFDLAWIRSVVSREAAIEQVRGQVIAFPGPDSGASEAPISAAM